MSGLATFRKHERICSKKSIDALFASGEKGFCYPLTYTFSLLPSAPEPGAAVLVSVPKKKHKRANKRNTIKRRIREAYRLNKAPLIEKAHERGVGVSLAMVYIADVVLDHKTIENAVGKILSEISERI